MAISPNLLIISSFVLSAIAALPPRKILWSKTSYGPDGPWQAVSVQIGTPPQSIDLIPGGYWMSNILDTTICSSPVQASYCYSQQAGLYNVSASNTNAIYLEPGPKITQSSLLGQHACIPQFGTVQSMFDTLTIADASQTPTTQEIVSFDMIVFDEAYTFLPDGSKYPMLIGNLGLGASEFNQSWARAAGPRINGTFLPSALFGSGLVESNSWGMHIGSASLGIPGSLYIGGYDRSRVLGPISAQAYGKDFLPIDLLDIGIGVAEGNSPFNFTSKSGLLAQGSSSIGETVKVDINLTSNWLYLARSTCDAIAENLPVIFQPKYGLYFWDTSDPRYQQIVSSPSFLSFSFRLNDTIAGNFTIKVPFALLNLTLTPPLVNTPTQYFPCQPHNASGSNPMHVLGRAFLQSAFVSVSWQESGHGYWFLAQAPGPKMITVESPTAIGQTDKYILSSSTNWWDTWKGTLTPLSQGTSTGGDSTPSRVETSTSTSASASASAGAGAGAGASSSSSAGGSGLSGGVIAGIGGGCAVAVIAAIMTITVLKRRRSRYGASMSSKSPTQTRYSFPFSEYSKKQAGFGPREMDAQREPVEIGSTGKASHGWNLHGQDTHYYQAHELPG